MITDKNDMVIIEMVCKTAAFFSFLIIMNNENFSRTNEMLIEFTWKEK